MAIPLKVSLPVGMPDYRSAGALLLLTAAATAVSVLARLSAAADLPTPAESLAAIGASSGAYATGGVARLLAGLALWAASVPLRRLLSPVHPRAMAAAGFLLAASGVITAVSGGCAVALAALAPDAAPAGVADVGGAESALLAVRWATGALGFTLAGLALLALAPAQWWLGGILRLTAVVGAGLGLAMLFIWLDAATVVHRITGVGFLIWLIVSGLWLIAGMVKPPENPPSRP